MEIPFIGGAYEGRSTDLNAQRTINLIPIVDKEGGKNVAAFLGTPGLKQFADCSKFAETRNMYEFSGYVYAVVGNALYEINSGGVATAQSGTLNTTVGPVWFADDGTNLMMVDGLNGYTFTRTSGAVTVISAEGFPPKPSSLAYQDGFFIVSKGNTARFYISADSDPTSWDPLDYATAYGASDDLLAIVSNHRELWMFGDETIEVWYYSGNPDFPFERISSAFIEEGIMAPASVVKAEQGIIWLSNKKRVMMAYGYNPKPISTQQIDYQLAQYDYVSDAKAYTYAEEGNVFYVLNIPNADATWVYDTASGLWHQRSSYPFPADGSIHRHRSNCYAYFKNKHLVGDYQDGIIWEMDLSTYKDSTYYIRRVRRATTVQEDRRQFKLHSFEVDMESGTGLNADDADIGSGQNPQMMMRYSNDGGHTWSNERWVDMGKIGERTTRAKWRRLGRSRNWTPEVVITDPVKVVLINAHLEAEATTI